MIPVEWFVALQNPAGGLFADPENLSQFGFVPSEMKHPLNPYQLPVGFAIEKVEKGRDVLGLTCAACHSADVTVHGKRVRIDGEPANIDFDTFYQALAQSVSYSLWNPAAFQRFAKSVLPKAKPDSDAVIQLKADFSEFEAAIVGDAQIRKPHLASGYGRVDALTQIINALSVNHQQWPENLRAIDAPTSYPHLWLTPKLEFVQWNPVASSPIARNGGEVLGVFGKSNLYSSDPEEQFTSSILIKELAALEQWLEDLQPPKWDQSLFGKTDLTLVQSGEALYKEHCLACHNAAPYAMTDPKDNAFGKTFIKIGRVDYKDVGTDPTYVEGLLTRLVTTRDISPALNEGQRVLPALQFFLNSVGLVLKRALDDGGFSQEEQVALNGFRFRPSVDGKPPEIYRPPSFTDLKAGPLAGIWATAPYLHNGSVPTLYELLSPESERRKVFWTGSHELDLERIGFVSENAPGRFRFDTTLPGNRNSGHNYPAKGLSHEERLAVIEYIKTL